MSRFDLRALPLLGLLAIACQNPAADQPRAEVGEATKAAAPAAAEKPTVPAPAEKLAFDQSTSRIDWIGSKVTGKHDGGFKTFSGQVGLDAAGQVVLVEVDIEMASVWSDVDKLTGHLRTGDFFAVDEFPTARFVASTFEAIESDEGTHKVSGELTLRGVTRPVSFPATLSVDDSAATAQATFVFHRKAFGVAYAGKPDDLVRDEVVLKLDVKAPRARAAAEPVTAVGE